MNFSLTINFTYEELKDAIDKGMSQPSTRDMLMMIIEKASIEQTAPKGKKR